MRCKCCGRPFPIERINPFSLWGEEVCRPCYMWAREAVYGEMTGGHLAHIASTPWPHGFQLEGFHAT